MFGFSFNKKKYSLGIDFGTSFLKIVELEHRESGIYLSNYGQVELPLRKSDIMSNLERALDEDEEIANVLGGLMKKMSLKSETAFISMGSYKGLSAIANIEDNGNKDDLNEIIKLEAHKYIPVSLDEVYLSSDIISRNGKTEVKEKESGFGKMKLFNKTEKGEMLEILLVAAPKEDVHKYEKIIEANGLKVESFELDIFSAVRSLVGNETGDFLIIDIGAKITNMILVENGIIKINRNINIGGGEITKNISVSMNISMERAEEFKKKNEYLKAEGKSIILPVINIIAKEASRIIEGREREKNGNQLNIIISGGGSQIYGLKDIFFDSLKTEVVIGNPWKNIAIENEDLKNIASDISPMYTVATGLALKGIRKG